MDPKVVDKIFRAVREKHEMVYRIPISGQQEPFLDDAPAKGPLWVSRLTVPAPVPAAGDEERSIVRAVREAIATLGDGSETYDIPECVDVAAEWVGPRAGVDRKAPEPKMSEREKYGMLLREVRNDAVLMYAHGGASYIGSAAASRSMTSTLATLTGSRVFSVNYRLTPQNPFPAQLVDLLLVYLHILHPPPGSLHEAIPESKIVFVGDSFGACLWLSLIQLILTLNNHLTPSSSGRTIRFRSQDVPLPVPAGVALASPYGYNPHVFPSWRRNQPHDLFPFDRIGPFFVVPNFPSDHVWPTNPIRGDLYCNTDMLAHPLVCPSAAKSWKGAPPMFFVSGQECCADSAMVVARQAALDGVQMNFEQYMGMCHIFITFFPRWRQSVMMYKHWTAFIKQCVENPGKIAIKAVTVGLEDLKERELDCTRITELTPEDAVRFLEAEKKQRRLWKEKLAKGKPKL